MKYFLTEPWYKLRSFFISKRNVTKIYNKINNDGFFVYENFLSEEKCEELIKSFKNNLDKENIWRDDLYSDTRMYGIERLDKSFMEIYENDILNEVYESYIANKMNSMVLCNHIIPVKENKGSGGGWHRDSINRRQLKFIIYLTDSTVKTGCFQYIKGSHALLEKYNMNMKMKLKSDSYRYSKDEVEVLLNEGYDISNLEGKKGDLIIVDTSGIHRGKPIEVGERYAVTKYMWDTNIPSHIQKLLIKD